MKKLAIALLFLTTSSFGQAGGVLAGAGIGAAVLGTGAGLITNAITKNNIQKAKDSIGCYVNGQKKAGWEGDVQLEQINVEAAKSTPLWN